MIEFKDAQALDKKYSTPVFLYYEELLRKAANDVLNFGGPFGFTPRFAMKANPHKEIVNLFNEMGIQIDASSGFEAVRAIEYGVDGSEILLTSQELPSEKQLRFLAKNGVEFNACSLHQLESWGRLFPGSEVSVRINPGEGSGGFAKTNVGGYKSSFGIWFEYLPDALDLVEKYDLTVKRLHTHIGSGTDPEEWARVAEFSLKFLDKLPDARIFNMGGGFKVARMQDQKSADLSKISKLITNALIRFKEETGREIHLEIEPGTYLVANAGFLLARIHDIVSTGSDGFDFLKINAGLTEIMRPSYYGAQHSMNVLSAELGKAHDYVVVGHCCENGDLLTPKAGDGDEPEPRTLTEASIGDYLLISGCGAYCASMCAAGYNSFPSAEEVMIK